MNINHILTHLGENREQYFNAVSPPIIQTSNFAFNSVAAFRQGIADEYANALYTRGNNPTVAILRKKLAALEGTEDALVLGSGSAAVAAAVIAQVRAGDHIVCVENPYSWTKNLLSNFLDRFGVSTTFVNATSLDAIEAAILPNTKLLYLESPNSLLFDVQDLSACADLARKYGLISCIDNSYASPIFQQPAKYGIDLIIHSGTKYLNGHSDVVCGVICGKEALLRTIFASEFMTLGAILPPAEAALVLRGLRTLPLRMQRHDESAWKIAQFLENHPKVERVIHPFLASYPQHKLAKRQMSGCGGLFSFFLKSNSLEACERFADSLHRFLIAVSWGGYESLIIPSAAFYGVEGKADSPIPFNMVRIFVGLEDPDWLIEDLAGALETL